MARRLGVGVIGLGRRWGLYRKAFRALPGAVRVRAVYDPSRGQAGREATTLGCPAVGAVLELLERSDLDAVLLLGLGWQGLWALEQAVRFGKHVLCAGVPNGDRDRLGAVLEQAAPRPGQQVQLAVAPRFGRLVRAFGALLATHLGPARLLRLHRTVPTGSSARVGGAWLPLLLACQELFQATPDNGREFGLPGRSEYQGLVLGFPEGRLAELSVWRGAAPHSQVRIEFVAERGSGTVELPGEVRWQDDRGSHRLRLPARPPAVEVLETFAQGIRAGVPTGPSPAAVCAALTWLDRWCRGPQSPENA